MTRFTLLLVAPCLMAAARVTPVQQVLGMLEDMKAKGEKAMEAEKAIFADYSVWVEDETTKLSQEIRTGNRASSKLAGVIEKAESDVSGLKKAIAKVDSEMSAMEAEKKAAVAQRAEERAGYKKIAADYQESIDATAMAIQQLGNQNENEPSAMLQLEKMANKVNGMRHVLAALLQTDENKATARSDTKAANAPKVIVDILEKLMDKFQKQLADAESVESNAAHAFKLQVQHLDDLLEEANADRGEKAGVKAKRTGQSKAAQSDLADTKADLAEDQKALSNVKVAFAEKKSQFEANQEVRAQEIEALKKARDVISSPTVSGLMQVKPVSFLQHRSHAASRRSLARAQAVGFLRAKAKALSSTALANVAAELANTNDPLAKVKEMLEGMLAKLKNEASDESDHHAWCDRELKKSKKKREKRTSKVATLAAEVEELDSTIQSMAATMAELSKEQADLSNAMSSATALRQTEKAKNLATIQDASAARSAVKKALAVLSEFYSNQALVQMGKQAPEMAAYGAMKSASNGVVGMIEVIETDFARLETETRAAESEAARNYDSFMAEAKADKKTKHKHEVKLALDKDQKEFELGQVKKSGEGFQEELDEANSYYEELKPNCVTVHVSYEERKARREEEIESLKETYKQLEEVSV